MTAGNGAVLPCTGRKLDSHMPSAFKGQFNWNPGIRGESNPLMVDLQVPGLDYFPLTHKSALIKDKKQEVGNGSTTIHLPEFPPGDNSFGGAFRERT